MRVVYYTRPSFLDPALSFIRAVSRRVELHILLELSPEAWQSASFDMLPMDLPGNVVSAASVLRDNFPASVQAYWQNAASFNVVVHKCRRSIHPATWWVSHKTMQFIHNLRPDLIHLDDVSLRFAGASFELGHIPVVMNVHDPEMRSGEGNWRYDLARRLTFSRVKRFILYNRTLKEPFCKHYRVFPDSVDCIPLGVCEASREWITRPIPQDNHMVLFFGRLSAYKGLEILYKAAPQVAEHIAAVHFVVAGRPVGGYQVPEPPKLPNGGRVEVIGEYISNARLAELFQQTAVVVCPYIEATQSAVVLTAFAFNRPVIATRVGGLPEYVEDGVTGTLVPPGDALALAEAIIRSLTDKHMQRQLMSGISRARAERLGWDSIGEQIMGTYSRTLDVRQNINYPATYRRG